LGEAVAERFLQSNISVVGISRSENKRLSQLAKENNIIYEHYTGNLTELQEAEKIIEKVSAKLGEIKPTTIYLVNNAAMVNPVHQASQISNRELDDHIQLNLTVPMMVTNALLERANDLEAEFIGLMITSGAAESPIYGWSAYCSSKAALNMYTKTVALEQEELASNHKIIAFNPGIMDTNMQSDIRKHSHEEFIDIERFKAYKTNQMLKSPEKVAEVIFPILTKTEKLINGHIYNVGDYL